jgi:hypothetical protein
LTKEQAIFDAFSKVKGQLVSIGVDRLTGFLAELSPNEAIRAAVPFGNRPPALYQHTFTLGVTEGGLYTGFFLFGGYTSAGYSDRLFILDYNKYTWYEILSSPRPPPRSLHVAAFYRGKYYVLGGINSQSKALCDAWRFSSAKTIFKTDLDAGEWTIMASSFLCISRPAFHSKPDSPLVYLFGGMDSQGNSLRTLTRISLDAETTETLTTTGDNPVASHSGMLSSFNNTLVLYGGISRIEGDYVLIDSIYTISLGKFLSILIYNRHSCLG